MPTLFDMLSNAQNGNGVDALSRQFGLSQQQTQAAMAALLPAFSQGLKQNTADPYGLGAFMTAMASGQHGQYFENPAAAFSPAGMAQGNDVLGQLFGSKDLSRAVAAQAAQATGISQDILKQMLPAMAAMIMGGLFKQTTNQLQANQAAGFGGSGNPLGDIIGEMMRQGGMTGGGQQQAPQQANPMDNPLGKILEGMFGGGAAQQPTQAAPGDNPLGKILEGMFGGQAQQAPQPRGRAQPAQPDNPLGKILEDMLGGGPARQAPEPEVDRDPPANPSGRAKNPYDDIFGKMFETGAQQRDDYQKGVESIFEQFTKGMDRNR